ncbi:lysozyme family protein [Catalinimonas alkaloidigena]|uniref:glycoside hydrolase family 108 protein n=1 Tax=Catalinimonas alkaloidigena TaxID=1075417 RepID=UPI002404C9BD|nr:glycosyl hydrolase 108 family protein [Catalinimonas alkaloidigena]MDF9799763.1 lysozyme family protein [Catalinimonas alkaloidigena]
MSFETAYNHLMQFEGNYAHVKGDMGGETYKGIARRYHPHWSGWATIDEYKIKHGPLKRNHYIPDPELDQKVKAFYLANYWHEIYCSKIADERVAHLMFDFYVHSGHVGMKIVQRCVNQLLDRDVLKIDGIVGKITLNWINKIPGELLHDLIKERRRDFLEGLASRPGQSKFLKGWMRRVDSFPTLTDEAGSWV